VDCFGSIFVILAVIAAVAARVWLSSKGVGGGDADGWNDPLDLSSAPRFHGPNDTPPHHGAEGFAVIRQSDPTFDVDGFYDHVGQMFLAIHEAAAGRDLRPVADFVEPALLEGVAQHLHADPDPLAPLKPDDLTIQRTAAMSVVREEGYDVIHILIAAFGPVTAADDLVDNPDADAPGPVVAFREYWTLVRAVGAKSQADWSLHKCPNFGAPIDADDRVKCSYCGVRLADPAYDWVVRRIAAD
jgi:predicted lipid-binding transport protein (Tim44 family)